MLEALLSHTVTHSPFAEALLRQGAVPRWASGGVSPQQQQRQGRVPVTAMLCPSPGLGAIKGDPSIPGMAMPPSALIACPLAAVTELWHAFGHPPPLCCFVPRHRRSLLQGLCCWPGWEPCGAALVLTKLFPDGDQHSQGQTQKGEQVSSSCRESETWHFSFPTRQTTGHASTSRNPPPTPILFLPAPKEGLPANGTAAQTGLSSPLARR